MSITIDNISIALTSLEQALLNFFDNTLENLTHIILISEYLAIQSKGLSSLQHEYSYPIYCYLVLLLLNKYFVITTLEGTIIHNYAYI